MAEDAPEQILQLSDYEPTIRRLLSIKVGAGASDAMKNFIDNFIDLVITNSELDLSLRVVLALPPVPVFNKKLACKALFLLFWKVLDEKENLLTRYDFTRRIVDLMAKKSAKTSLQAFRKEAQQLLEPLKEQIDTCRHELVAHSAHKGEHQFLEIDRIDVQGCLAVGGKLLKITGNQISQMSYFASRHELFL